MNKLIIYYQKRAQEYELGYQKQERQSDLSAIKETGVQFEWIDFHHYWLAKFKKTKDVS